jgi:hypothetical protein
MNGAAISWKVRKQSTVSNNTAEAEVKSCSVGTELILAMADLHGEITHQTHGSIRAIGDSQGAENQILLGLDSKASAPYKRSQAYCEDAAAQGLIWLDHIDGKNNPADVFTKAVPNIAEFKYKADVVSGAKPHLCESADVIAIKGAL